MVVNLLASAAFVCGQVEAVSPGDSTISIDHNGQQMEVLIYKPAAFEGGSLLIVFPGAARNAEDYRNDARGMADRSAALVAVPYLDRERFPAIRYQRGALVSEEGVVAPRDEW